MGRFLRLARVTAWPAYSLAFVVPFAAGAYEPISWFEVAVGFLALLMFAAFAFALNFYSDRDTDRYHDGVQKDFDLRHQPMVTGEVSDRECQMFCLATFLSAIGLSFAVSGVFAALVILACLIGGILYSHPRIRLKAKPLGDVLCMSLVGVLIPSAGFLLGFGALPTGLMMLLWFFITAAGYIASVMSDFEFDRKAGLRTTAVWLGQVGGLRAMLASSLTSLAVAILVFGGYYPVGTRYFALLSAVGALVLTALVWRFLRPPRMQLPVVSRRRWIFPAFGLVSAVCLCYACLKLYLPHYLPWDPFTAL
jgi:lycopene elongase/hydratase (dihydrobisanhydrobacterioruberin-forming)